MKRHLASHPVDLLLLDVMLPGEDGLSLAREPEHARRPADHHAVGARRGSRPHRRPRGRRRRLPAQALQPPRAAGARGGGAAAPAAGRASGRIRRFGPFEVDLEAPRLTRNGEEVERLRRRVRPAQGAARESRPRARPRCPGRPAEGLRARALRPHGRRARHAAAPQDRARSGAPGLPAHRLGRGLPLLARRDAQPRHDPAAHAVRAHRAGDRAGVLRLPAVHHRRHHLFRPDAAGPPRHQRLRRAAGRHRPRLAGPSRLPSAPGCRSASAACIASRCRTRPARRPPSPRWLPYFQLLENVPRHPQPGGASNCAPAAATTASSGTGRTCRGRARRCASASPPAASTCSPGSRCC